MTETNTTPPAPFLKWAGGKSQLLDQYEPYFPTTPGGSYFEPFAGSGAVFFHLRERGLFDAYHLAEINEELVNCYRVVRDEPDELIRLLAEHDENHDREYYYFVRGWDREDDWDTVRSAVRAARMIYLNKTCYNGLWRVNRRGQFNVPIGSYKNPDILNADKLRAASHALQGVTLNCRDFEHILYAADKGDFVYLDPPYVPLSRTARFTGFSAHRFEHYEHEKLALVFKELDRKGCRVMLSNSDTGFVRALYKQFHVETVQARRAINSQAAKRGKISELVIVNY